MLFINPYYQQSARDAQIMPQSHDEMMREADRKEQYSGVGSKYIPPTPEELARDQQRVDRWNALGQRALTKDGRIVPFIIEKSRGAQKAVASQKLKISSYYDELPKKLDGRVYKYWDVWAGKDIGFVCRLASMAEDFPWMPYREMHDRLVAALAALREE